MRRAWRKKLHAWAEARDIAWDSGGFGAQFAVLLSATWKSKKSVAAHRSFGS